jgi:gliding motility-associated protein GldM
VEDFKEDNLDASTRLFETHGEGPKLERKLEDYRAAILNIDPEINSKFANNFPVEVGQPIHGNDGKIKSFTTAYFHMTPTVAALTILSKFQNNIKNAENQVVSYCHTKIGEVVVHLNKVGILVGQSSNYLMPGQELTVTAGIGAYSSEVKSNISINGSGINLVDGQGEYKTTVSGSGQHSINVTGNFVGEDGKSVPVNKTIEYIVGVPGGTAVMLDKMNVFYIGVPNPITISSGTGWDKTTVSMTGGTITGSGSNRVVTVSAIGTATITVNADGHPSKFDFRVKRIPDPIIKVGASSGGRMPAAAFRVQQFVAAVLENFDFQAEYKVTAATIYFNNPGDRNVKQANLSSGSLAPAKAFMDALVPGSTVIFDNIRVVGPDGQARTIQNPPGFSLY